MKSKIVKSNVWKKVALLLFAGALFSLAISSERQEEAEIWRDLMCPVEDDVCFINFCEESPDGGLRIVEFFPYFDREFNDILVLPEVIINE